MDCAETTAASEWSHMSDRFYQGTQGMARKAMTVGVGLNYIGKSFEGYL